MKPSIAPRPLRSLAPIVFGLLALVAGSVPMPAQQFTAADLPGPDGIVYPDWRFAGIAGGIPTNLVVRATISAAQNTDIAAQLETAAATAAAAGGGIVSIPAGNYNLSRPVLIRQSNVVFRGAGIDTTKLFFKYQAPTNDIVYYQHPAGVATLYKNTFIQAHADPNKLIRISIYAKNSGAADSTRLLVTERIKAPGSWGFTFSASTTGTGIYNKVSSGLKELITEGGYDDNGDGTEDRVITKRATYTIQNANDNNATPSPTQLGAISFCGAGQNSSAYLLTADGLRGQQTVQVPSGHVIVAGDVVEIRAPATARWDAEVENACTGELFRLCLYQVESVTATSATFTQPLRIDYPVIDGSYVQRVATVKRCGVESLTLQQDYNIWTSGLIYSWGYECWAKSVKVNKAGRLPIYFVPGKFCEVRDSICNDAWYKGEGGTAYVGFERAYDCLMDNMTTYEMRHAPLVQWSAAGNVIRNSTFYDSDAQWHSGWTNENLFENCVVFANRGNGAYGYGMWASPPEDVQHGPNGPRNVVYRCDVTSPLDGAWLGGMNRNWLFLHNRFAADSGVGLFAKKNSGGHIIENNAFLLRRPGTGVELADADCDQVEIVGNQFRGISTTGDISLGGGMPGVNSGNTVADLLQLATFTNPGFESDLTGWSISGDNGMTAMNTAAKRSGAKGVRVTDGSATLGSSLLSPVFTVTPGRVYAARASSRHVSGSAGTGLYVNFYNNAGTNIRSTAVTVSDEPYWRLVETIETAPATAATARIYVHSYSGSIQTVDFDDFSFGELPKDIANPGFEWGLEAWDLTGDNGMSSASTAAKQSGTYGLRITDSSSTAGSACSSRKVACTPGVEYQVRFYSKIVSGSGIGVYLQFFDGADALLQPPLLVSVPVNSAWSENLYRVAAPANAATVRVQVHSYAASIVTADFDNFVLLELPARPTVATPSIFDWQRNPVFALANPGFDSGLTGWDNANDAGMSAGTSLAARTGSQGLRVTDGSATAGSSLKSAAFPVGEGYNYRVDFYARLVSSSGVGVYLLFYNASGSQLADTGHVGVPGTAPTAWTALNLTKRAPAGAVSARIWVHSYSTSIVTADFDDFSFRAVWD